MRVALQRGARPRRGAGARSIAFAIVAAVLCLVGAPAVALAAAAESALVLSSLPLASCPEEEAASAPLPPEPMCAVVAVDPDEDGFFAAAPICDPSGASAVAPAPIHPIGNDRLEATPTCADPFTGPELDRDRSSDGPTERPLTAVDPAVVPSMDAPPRWAGVITNVDPGAVLGPADGVRHRLEHPPTAR